MEKVTPRFTARKCGMQGALGCAVLAFDFVDVESGLGSSKHLVGEMAEASVVTPREPKQQQRGGSGTTRLPSDMPASKPVGNDRVDGQVMGLALAVPP